MTTGYYTHSDCRSHEMGRGHPECPERLIAIEEHLRVSGTADLLDWREAPAAAPGELELAHAPDYINALRGRAARLAEEVAAGGPPYAQIDPDTAMNVHTWQAILRASGAAIAATDAVMAGEIENAFCAVRPPGHHACRDHAMGFCFVNNVAVAALHALKRHGLSRVAIVDFDVHHGNGTEDIVRNDPRILMVGLFQHPFYPYSGAEPLGPNIVNVPLPAHTRGARVRECIEQIWLPRLAQHQPEMIFISAGFDAHREDDLGQLGLVEAYYAWITAQIMTLAARHAQGRIVSCLEGGYNLQALGRSVQAHVRTLAGF